MSTLLSTFLFIIVFSNPFTLQKTKSNFPDIKSYRYLSTIYQVLPTLTVTPTEVKSNHPDNQPQNNSIVEGEKVKAYNSASEKVINNVSLNAVKNSNVLISCQDNPELCISPTSTPSPHLPISPTITPLPTTTPTLTATPTPTPTEIIIPITPINPCPQPCPPNNYENNTKTNRAVACLDYIEYIPCPL